MRNDALNQARIQEGLTVPATVVVLESVDSTNTYLMQQASSEIPLLCVAEQQTHGRGRLARTWVSPLGENLYLSYRVRLPMSRAELLGLSLVVGLVIKDVLDAESLPEPLQVKWPNDVLCDGKKIAGVLIESQASGVGHSDVVIGIGLNVHMQEADSTLQAWCSLAQVTNRVFDRNALCIALIERLQQALALFVQKGFLPFHDAWMQADAYLHRVVSLQYHDTVMSGEVLGVDMHGQLLLRLPQGEVGAYALGEVSALRTKI